MDTNPHTIRFPRDLKRRVQEEARKEHRSFNAQVIRLIELGLTLLNTLQGAGKIDDS